MKKTLIEVEVCTATQCSFIPFTAVPNDWAGKEVSDFIENGFIPVGGISIHPELGMVAQAVYQRETRSYILSPEE